MLSKEQLLERFAEVHEITAAEAAEMVGGETDQETFDKIAEYTKQQIEQHSNIKLNRKQRRALAKKGTSKTAVNALTEIQEKAKQLTYIHLIEGLRDLNAKKEEELTNGEITIENN